MVGGRNGAGLGVEFLARYAESEGGLVELAPTAGSWSCPNTYARICRCLRSCGSRGIPRRRAKTGLCSLQPATHC